MQQIWELDFYSRPLLDQNQKKRWELLVCDSARQFQFVKFCSGAEANARWLETSLTEALPLWQAEYNLPDTARPEKIRFFRRQMNSIITRACGDFGVPALPSRRTFALARWLQERQEQVYPQDPGYQPQGSPPLTFEIPSPQPLPDALRGQNWTFANLPVTALDDAGDWEMSFGELFDLSTFALDPTAVIPGVIIFSPRAVPLAGWMSGLELACVQLVTDSPPQLVLETGASDRWVLARLREPQLLSEAKTFEQAKHQVQQVHFLAVQTTPQAQTFAGFWLLQAADLP
jgi:hypothetical protein